MYDGAESSREDVAVVDETTKQKGDKREPIADAASQEEWTAPSCTGIFSVPGGMPWWISPANGGRWRRSAASAGQPHPSLHLSSGPPPESPLSFVYTGMGRHPHEVHYG